MNQDHVWMLMANGERRQREALERSMSTPECDGCKFWSELCASQIGNGPLKALCLNPDAQYFNKMVHRGCAKFEPGRAVDDPCQTAGEMSRGRTIP